MRSRPVDRRLVLALLVAVLASVVLVVPLQLATSAGAAPPPASPPPAPKTEAQIQAEAYALQAQISAAAGRKTSNATDGTGGSTRTITNANTTGAFYDPKSGVCSADSSHVSPSYPAANGCDGNVSTQWLTDAGVNYPHYFVFNLTQQIVSYIAVDWNNYPPATFHVDCWLSSAWTNAGSFAATANDLNSNKTYALNQLCYTTAIRIYGTGQSATSTQFMGLFEVWAYAYWPLGPGVFTSSALGMGDWTSVPKFLQWTHAGFGSVDIFGRVSNNSDMSSASGWVDASVDMRTFGIFGGFFQYRVYLNGTGDYIFDIQLLYVGQSWGDPPSKTSAGVIAHDSGYVHARFNLTVASQVLMPNVPGLRFSASYLEYGGASALLNVTDGSNVQAIGPAVSLTVTLINSTFDDSSYFFTMHTVGSVYRSGSVLFNLDNVTLQHFDALWHKYLAVDPNANAPSVHDSDILDYNRGNNADTAIPFSWSFLRSRTHDYRAQNVSQNGAITQNVRQAKWNYMVNGFLQFVYGSDGTGVAVGPGTPVEFVNWSYNYAEASRHTVFGTYGTAFGQFADPTLQHGYYQTIYRNYINRSRYIAIQSSGNVSGLRVIGNYIQGPSSSFSEGIGIFGQDHDFVVQGTRLWNMDTLNNVGISIGCFVYNVTVDDTIAYRVGASAIAFVCQGLKYKDPGGTEHSDYSWKGMSISVSHSYFGDFDRLPPVSQDSGYVHYSNVTVVRSSVGVLGLSDGWGCGNCSYAWADWTDGYPSLSQSLIAFDSSVLVHPGDYWGRDLRVGSLGIGTPGVSAALLVSPSNATYFGTLAARCAKLATDQEVRTWSGHSCGPVSDRESYSVSPAHAASVLMPGHWANVSKDVSLSSSWNLTWTNVTNGTVTFSSRDSGFGYFADVVASYTTFSPAYGDDLVATLTADFNGAVSSAFGAFWLLLFVVGLGLVIGAAWIVRTRYLDGGGGI